MPSKEPTDPEGPAIRRAEPLPGSAPAAERKALPVRKGRRSGPSGTARPDESASSSGPVAATPEPSTDAAAGAGGDTDAIRAMLAAGFDNGPPAPEPATATNESEGGGEDKGEGEEPSSGRRTKALRAAAALTGALLIAVPLIVLGTDDDEKGSGTGRAAGATVPEDGSQKFGSYKGKSKDNSERDSGDRSDRHTEPDSARKNSPAREDKGEDRDGNGDADSDGTKAKRKSAKREHSGTAFPKDGAELVNAMTGMCADVPGKGKGKDGGHINQDPCADDRGEDNQVWIFDVKQRKPGKGRLFVIRNSKDGRCMDLPGYGSVPGATGVVEAGCDGTAKDNQLWWLDDRDDGKHWIRNYRSEQMCLDVSGKKFGGGGEDARLTVVPCNPKDDHAWGLA
ncbi:RICIN domain-containing protein [Streptomyces sp. NPDC048172]|uniref:RICIN domain-containing protein n=1 Tax=Streptomyces sp. NPDC048172 TaxID=3365505 RepID=UPI0037133315